MMSEVLLDSAKKVKPLVDAIVKGYSLEFRLNNGIWRDYKGINLSEIVLSPHRFRVKQA